MKNEDIKAYAENRLRTLKERTKQLHEERDGNENDYTYHGGYVVGYWDGQITILENILDILER